ncbi:MAG: hypothetical protein KDA84_25105 [Planctomycetaceae bacterium]|nr:hypothetical protein [Planctomycetaceae bacterium]
MKYREEAIARDLYRELVSRFDEWTVEIAGAGVHWHCDISHNNRSCRISCFATESIAEFYTTYRQESCDSASSRIPSSKNTLNAVTDWLNGSDLATLYERYAFVDHKKRYLAQLWEQVLVMEPDLAISTSSELRQEWGDSYELAFSSEDRACRLSFYGKNEWPDARFSWDECQLFTYQPHDTAQLAGVLRGWLCNKWKPSQMRQEFPWLKIGELADYYENGKPIEGEFVKSWDYMEQFYDELNYPYTGGVRSFIAAMRLKGYDKTLRAGQSLSSLILSRSRRHGMRLDQPRVIFQFGDEGMVVYSSLQNQTNLVRSAYRSIKLSPAIETLLNQLQSTPID